MKKNRKIKTPRVSLLTKIRETEQKRFLSSKDVMYYLHTDYSLYSDIDKALRRSKYVDLVKYSYRIINTLYFENKLVFLLNERALGKYFFEYLVDNAKEGCFVTYLRSIRSRTKRLPIRWYGIISHDIRDECMLGYVIELVIKKRKTSFLKNILWFYQLTPEQECLLLNSYKDRETELDFYFKKFHLYDEALEMLCLPEYGKMFEFYDRFANLSIKYHWKRFLNVFKEKFVDLCY